MKILWRDHKEVVIMLAGLVALILGFAIEFAPDEKTYPYAHDIGYGIWLVCYTCWFVMVVKKNRVRHARFDDHALTDFMRFSVFEDMDVKYFVVDESNHTTVNWWRWLRGKQTIRLYKGGLPTGGITTESNTTYAVTKKQLFEMRLKGYTEDAGPEAALAALKNEWLQSLRGWFR